MISRRPHALCAAPLALALASAPAAPALAQPAAAPAPTPPAATTAPTPTPAAASAPVSAPAAASPSVSAPAASPSPSAPSPAAPVEVVVTGTRTPESSQRATVRTRVVTRDEAERRGATNVGEALDGELGVQVNPSAYGSLGNPSAIQIQGFDLDRVLVLEDGERVIGDSGGAIDLSSLPLSDVSRIEIVTGPTSSLYGTNAIGGVVNVLSAPPAQPGPSARARLEARSRFGLLLQGSAAYKGDPYWASADASFQRDDGVSLRDGEPQLSLPARSQRLLGLRLGAALGRGIDVRLRGRWIHDAQDGLQLETRPIGVYTYDLPEATDRFTLNATQSIDLGHGSNLRFTGSRQWAFRTADRDLRDSPENERRERTGVLQSLEGIATLADGEARTWVVGTRFEIENLSQTLERAQVTPSGVARSTVDEVDPSALGAGSLYAQLSWKLFDVLTVMPGVRGEVHLGYGGVVAPRLALAYRPAPALTVRISGGRGYRAPSAKEIGFSFDHSYLGYRVEGNPDLVPETSWGVNGDVTVVPDPRVTLRAGAFANWVDHLIDIDTKPTSSTDGVDDYKYVNINAARTAGAELSATVRAAGWLRADVGYAYLWTRDDANARPLVGKPPHTVQASIQADLPGKLALTARYRAVLSTFIDEATRAPGFQTLDARLARPLWPSSQAYVGVRNVLGVQRDPDRFGDQRPIEGRTLYLGLTAELPWEEP